MAPFDESRRPGCAGQGHRGRTQEIRSQALYAKPRWLVLNKLDMIDADARATRVKDFIRRFRYKGPVFEISALTHEGCEQLVKAVYQHIKAQQVQEQPSLEVDPRFTGGQSD
jgi:GTP-binding protein